MISEVPPSMVLAWARRKPTGTALASSGSTATRPMRSRRPSGRPSQAIPAAPSMSTASFWSRLLYSAWNSFVTEPYGPASAPLLRRAAAR